MQQEERPVPEKVGVSFWFHHCLNSYFPLRYLGDCSIKWHMIVKVVNEIQRIYISYIFGCIMMGILSLIIDMSRNEATLVGANCMGFFWVVANFSHHEKARN